MGYLSTKGPATGGTSKDRLITFGRNLVLILVSVYVCNSPLFPQDPVPPFSSFLFFRESPVFSILLLMVFLYADGGICRRIRRERPVLSKQEPSGRAGKREKKGTRERDVCILFPDDRVPPVVRPDNNELRMFSVPSSDRFSP